MMFEAKVPNESFLATNVQLNAKSQKPVKKESINLLVSRCLRKQKVSGWVEFEGKNSTANILWSNSCKNTKVQVKAKRR